MLPLWCNFFFCNVHYIMKFKQELIAFLIVWLILDSDMA
jgi:hypothetical protein